MRVKHSVPEVEAEDHLLEQHCPCDPRTTAAARPGAQPTVTITHDPLSEGDGQ